MADLDNFKQINDQHGHLVGDEVIQHVSRMLLTVLRSYDIVGRWGGDEFVIVLPGCSKQETDLTLARIQAEVSRKPVMTTRGAIPINLTMGAISVTPKSEDIAAEWLKKADDELLKLKKNGKGRAAVSTDCL